MMPLIELKAINKTYFLGELDVPVLHDITFNIDSGEYVALIGASGSGKSTLMNILGCLDRPTSGDYFFEGVELGRASSGSRARVRNAKIGFVFQSFNLLPRTSALENVLMPLTYSAEKLSSREQRARARELLEMVGLKDRMGHYPSQLSGGQQQRVAIARALVSHPSILFADEPTGNLDSRTSVEVMQMFGDLNRRGITVVLVTHDPTVAAKAARVVKIHDGRVIADGKAEEVVQ